MFNTIVQILLGIIYGLYLAILAPTSQRQKAHEWLAQQTKIPTVYREPKQQKTPAVVELTTQPALVPDLVEDPKLAELSFGVTKRQENPRAVATHPILTKLLHPEALDFQQNAKTRKKTNRTKNQQPVAVAQAGQAVPVEISKMTVAQLRSLCLERNIKWRNAHGSRHLTKTEMLERLIA